jgi:hypothetical protein
LADEVAWIFFGILIGIPLGTVAGWIIAQVVQPRASTVLVERTQDGGYLIVEK